MNWTLAWNAYICCDVTCVAEKGGGGGSMLPPPPRLIWECVLGPFVSSSVLPLKLLWCFKDNSMWKDVTSGLGFLNNSGTSLETSTAAWEVRAYLARLYVYKSIFYLQG